MREQSQSRSVDTEGVIIAVRWVAVVFAALQTATYYRPIPVAVHPWAWGIIAAFAIGSLGLTAWWLRIRRDDRAVRSRRRFGVTSLALDTTFALALTWAYAFDVNTAIFIVLYLPPLEGALRYGMRGAVATMAAATLGYAARDVWASAQYDIDVLPASISFRTGVGLLVAVMAGAMADRYEAAHRQVTRALEQERAATDALRSLDELRSTFLAAVSHELRTPLTSILGFSLTIQQSARELDPDTRDMLGFVVSESRQLERLLQDLLDIERVGRGGVTLSRYPVDVASAVRRLAERVEMRLGREVLMHDDCIMGVVDEVKTERIIDNLLSNAVKYSPPGTDVRVLVDRSGDGVLIVVEDEGPGVPERLRDSIFEPFERGMVTSAHQPGTGIGLSLVDRFARLHGGRAWVQERADQRQGSAFHVFLPDGPEGVSFESIAT